MIEVIDNYDLLYKMIIIGDTYVGKSNILSRYLKDEFLEDTKRTVGVELGTKLLKIKDTGIKLQIWDTSGQERYLFVTSSYYRGSLGCFIVYDITSSSSFQSVDKWFEWAKKEVSKDAIFVLVGNKCDLEKERQVPKEQGEEKAKNLNCAFFEVSALSKINIDDIFTEMVNTIYDRSGEVKDEDNNIEFINENDKAVSFADCILNLKRI